MNTLYLGNIPPDNPPEKITKVSTTSINIIHTLTREITNIIMGITIIGRNNLDPRTNISSLWYYNSKGSNFSTWWCLFTAPSVTAWEQLVNIEPAQAMIYHNNRNQILYLINTTTHLKFCHPCLHDNQYRYW